MRINHSQRQAIKQASEAIFGPKVEVRVFGSRLDDTTKGGDIDLLVTTPEPVEHPALDAARLSAQLSRVFDGRKVDVLLKAPSLKELPIHKFAFESGQRL